MVSFDFHFGHEDVHNDRLSPIIVDIYCTLLITAEREQNGFAVHLEEKEELKQMIEAQRHIELHAITKVLEDHQTKIEIIREMLDEDQGK